MPSPHRAERVEEPRATTPCPFGRPERAEVEESRGRGGPAGAVSSRLPPPVGRALPAPAELRTEAAVKATAELAAAAGRAPRPRRSPPARAPTRRCPLRGARTRARRVACRSPASAT